MTGQFLSRRHISCFALCLMLLAGCDLLIGQSAPQLYRLTPQPGVAADAPFVRRQLVVDAPVAPQSLDTVRIALTRGRTKLDYYANSAWTDRAPVLLQGVLVEAFENSGRIAAVARDAGSLTPDYALETELRDFEARDDGTAKQSPTVVVRLIVKLVKTPERQLVGDMQVTEMALAQGDSLDSVVEAFDVAVGKALGQIVPWTLRGMTHGRHGVGAGFSRNPSVATKSVLPVIAAGRGQSDRTLARVPPTDQRFETGAISDRTASPD